MGRQRPALRTGFRPAVRGLAAGAALAASLVLSAGCGGLPPATWDPDVPDFVPPESERLLGRTASSGTLPDPRPVDPYPWSEEGYVPVFEDDLMAVSFKESRDIFHIRDKRTGYVWSTGIDAGMRQEDMMNRTFASFANSFVTFEYLDPQGVLNKVSSTLVDSDGDRDRSTLADLGNGRFLLSVNTGEDGGFAVDVSIRFDQGVMRVDIDPATIRESDPDKALAALYIAPFLGAVGGRVQVRDEETGDTVRVDKMPGYDGYLFVPDGPGALIRFRDYPMSLSPYQQRVYGIDPGSAYTGTSVEFNRTGRQTVRLPVYGVAHGRDQAAFAAFATAGAEYMSIVASPRGNTTLYHYVTNRFLLRDLYFQVLNQQGQGIQSFPKERSAFPISMTFAFLAGTDADYVGMAQAYRSSLLERGLLQERPAAGDPGIRVDVLMADVKKWVFGHQAVVMTTADDLLAMAEDLAAMGIPRVSFGLYGWQRGGLSAQHPDRAAFDGRIGGKRAFLDLQDALAALGCSLSFAQDHTLFTSAMADVRTGAVTHIGLQRAERLLPFTKPVFDRSFYARPAVSARWLESQARSLRSAGFPDMTLDGLASLLTSDFSNRTATSRDQALALAVAALADVREAGTSLSAKQANEYALPFLDALTEMPMVHSQYLIETDAVPFLPIVLSGTLAAYSPYVNFSFYTQADVLRMIDYGVRPSFLVTGQSSHLLSRTNSNDLYSTGYGSQRGMIRTVAGQVLSALAPVSSARILDREVLSPDVVQVRYDNGVRILVNYSRFRYRMDDQVVEAQDFLVLGG